MTQPIDDKVARALLRRIVGKDERAFAELHRLMARRIYAFTFHRLQNEDMAETVVADTMLEVWHSAARFRGESLVSTWIFGIARFKRLELARQEPQDERMKEDIDEHSEDLVSDAEDGEVALDKWQQQQIVRNCLKTLTAAHRECMQLVYYEGLPLAEIARVQAMPENTIKTRLYYARKYMRACVERGGGSP